MINNRTKKQKGFTIVELLISVAIFTIIVFFSLGSVVVIFSSNRKSESIRTAIDNANFAMDTMVRDIKFGKDFNYMVGLNFEASNGERVYYGLIDGQIQKKIGINGTYLPVTSSVYKIDSLNFTVNNEYAQPLITVFIKGTALPSSKEATDFSLQTTVSSRQLNI